MELNDKKQRVQAEIDYHEQVFYVDSGHWTSLPPFATRERHWLATHVEKIRFYSGLERYIRQKPYYKKAKVLIAPIGIGEEVQYLENLYQEIHGVDISEKALAQCPANIIKKQADLLDTGLEDETYDIIICPLFLHHVHKVGFHPFLQEFRRLLRSGGTLAIQEPGSFFLPSKVAGFLRYFLGNVTGLVEDEIPVNPNTLTNSIKEVGFTRVKCYGLSFSHVRYPVFLQAINIVLDWPWRRLWPFKLFSNGIGWYCEKPN